MLVGFRRGMSERPATRPLSVIIKSRGGRAEIAMEIGRAIRRAEGGVAVEEQCASACVLVLAGGVRRHFAEGNGAQIGIHRLYWETPSRPLSVADVQSRTTNAIASVKRYLREMNVQERLVDDMMLVAPDRIRWLNRSELESYGIDYGDPVFDEARKLNAALRLGISRQEYERRLARWGSVCGLDFDSLPIGDGVPEFAEHDPPAPRDPCRDDVMNGRR
jgi:hypothetical protein